MAHSDLFLRLCRARDRLCDVQDAPLSIAQVAREASVSPYHFIRQFEALFGDTPHQLRIRARLDRAKVLLAQGNHSVTEVCMEVGFESVGSFSGLFTRRVGVAPSIYQRQARAFVAVPGMLPLPLFPGCLSFMFGAPLVKTAIFEKRSAGNLRD
jgi:AraC-like DNA-binding protein